MKRWRVWDLVFTSTELLRVALIVGWLLFCLALIGCGTPVEITVGAKLLPKSAHDGKKVVPFKTVIEPDLPLGPSMMENSLFRVNERR